MKKLIAIILLALFTITSCKKDSPLQVTSGSKNSTTNTVLASYNITYHLWYPYQTIGAGSSTADSILIISLDSTNIHNSKLSIIEQYAGTFGISSPTPMYSYTAEVSRSGPDTTVFFASLKSNSTCILTNDSINDNLLWAAWLDLRDITRSINGGVLWGDWDFGRINDGFVAIKIVTPLGNKYGWIKLDVPDCYHMTMQAQALNNNLGQYIQAGQTH